MSIITDMFKGLMILSIFAIIQNGCSVRNMAEKAAQAHKKGLTSYGAYSRALTGVQESWAKPKRK
ncbi:MAG: hypothetical protein H6626_05415 [Pseudobdellovibrionaceae bacterium]|nr:MAG: hypothetical protein H6626_05415 [Pseudobdellovibrionaceae bacterium]